MWTINIKQNVLAGNWSEEFNCRIYYVNFWVLASDGKNHYIHYFFFGEDYDKAAKLVDRIKAADGFTPEGKPAIWIAIRDTKEIKPLPWRRRKNWWIEYGK